MMNSILDLTIDYEQTGARLKLLAHPERLRILDAVRRDAECVCHLEVLLGKPQPYISQQLRLLREAGALQDEKQGQNVFYRLVDDELLAWLDVILGPIADGSAAATYGRPVAACPCPKCNDSQEMAPSV